jgi:2-alkyl-3-oxoalkanoate reductase
MRKVITVTCRQVGLDRPARRLDLAARRERTQEALPGLTDHQFELLSVDHW